MAQIALAWYTLTADSIVVTRDEAAAHARQVGLPATVFAMTTPPGAFAKSCAATVVQYVGVGGILREARAHLISRRPEVVSYEVRRDDGLRLAQVKHYAARRSDQGTVNGSARVKTLIGPSLGRLDKRGAQTWIDEFAGRYAEHQWAPMKVVRRVAQAAFTEVATPVLRRRWIWFVYVDQLGPLNRLREFLARVSDDSEVVALPIESGSDSTVFITSADIDMATRITDFNTKLAEYEGQVVFPDSELFTTITAVFRGLKARVEDHESRLNCALPTARSSLAQSRKLLRLADPQARLIRACTR